MKNARRFEMRRSDIFIVTKRKDLGSAASGNFGHAGRPGQVGGSAPDGDSATDVPILKGVDSHANAERLIEGARAMRDGYGIPIPTPEQVAQTEADLRALPLIHGTTVAGAVGAMEDGLLSHAAMTEKVGEFKVELDDLRDELAELAGSEVAGSLGYLDAQSVIDSVDLDPDDEKLVREKIAELNDIQRVVDGTTNPADQAIGLDKFVFMTHGEKHPDYGSVGVVVDNDVLTQQGSFATEKDIVVVSGGASFNEAGERERYNDRRIDNYKKLIVQGDDYYKVAAEKSGTPTGLANRGREHLFEVKAPTVPKSAVKGFVVYDDLDEAERLSNALQQKFGRAGKDKVLYISSPHYNQDTVAYTQRQLKAIQATGMWDDDLQAAQNEEYDGSTFVL